MIVTFWGVRGSIPVPGKSTLRYGGNTPCVSIQDDETLLILDCGTGLRELGMHLMNTAKGNPIEAHILISHTHWDHIQGFPFFVPAFIPSNTFTIYGAQGVNRHIEDTLAGQMESPYFPVSLNEMTATLRFEVINKKPFHIGKFTITTCFLNHPGIALGFRISCDAGDVVYFSDHEPYLRLLTTPSPLQPAVDPLATEAEKIRFAKERDRDYTLFCKNADLLIEDAPYTAEEYKTKAGWGHACIDDVVAMAIEADIPQLALFHHEPNHPDKRMDEIVQDCRDRLIPPGVSLHCFAAREGLRIEFPAASSFRS